MIRNSKKIQFIDFSSNAIDTKNMQIIANAIANNNSIKELNLSNMYDQLNPKIHIEAIKTVMNNNNLLSINLSNNNIHSQKLVSILECLINHNNIMSIDLSRNDLFKYNDDDKISVSDLEKTCNLLAHNHYLKTLNLSSTSLGDALPSILTHGIGQNTSIQHLDLSYNHLRYNYKVVDILSDIIRNNKVLKSLNLARNDLSEQSLKSLINSLEANNTIQVLNLSENELGDEEETKLNNYLQRNIDNAIKNSNKEEVELITLSSDITSNENNECTIIGDMIDGTDNCRYSEHISAG